MNVIIKIGPIVIFSFCLYSESFGLGFPYFLSFVMIKLVQCVKQNRTETGYQHHSRNYFRTIITNLRFLKYSNLLVVLSHSA